MSAAAAWISFQDVAPTKANEKIEFAHCSYACAQVSVCPLWLIKHGKNYEKKTLHSEERFSVSIKNTSDFIFQLTKIHLLYTYIWCTCYLCNAPYLLLLLSLSCIFFSRFPASVYVFHLVFASFSSQLRDFYGKKCTVFVCIYTN